MVREIDQKRKSQNRPGHGSPPVCVERKEPSGAENKKAPSEKGVVLPGRGAGNGRYQIDTVLG